MKRVSLPLEKCMTTAHARGRRSERGFTLIELVASILIIGALGTIAVPVYVDLRASARVAVNKSAGATFAAALQQAKANFLVKGSGGAQLDVPGFGDGTLDYSDLGFPVGKTLASTGATSPTYASELQCKEVLEALIKGVTANTPADGYPAPGKSFYAYTGGAMISYCYFYLLDSSGQFSSANGNYIYFMYDIGTPAMLGARGRVLVFNPYSGQNEYFEP